MATNTYVPLATFTGSGTHAFTGISQAYDHLIVVGYHKKSGSGSENGYFQVGNNTYATSTYGYRWYGAGSSGGFGSNGDPNAAVGMLSATIDTNYYSVFQTIIFNYSSTTMMKNYITRNGGYNAEAQSDGIWGGYWNGTSAINQLQVVNNLAAGSMTTLYGLVAH